MYHNGPQFSTQTPLIVLIVKMCCAVVLRHGCVNGVRLMLCVYLLGYAVNVHFAPFPASAEEHWGSNQQVIGDPVSIDVHRCNLTAVVRADLRTARESVLECGKPQERTHTSHKLRFYTSMLICKKQTLE